VIHYKGESTVKDGIYYETVSGIYAVFLQKSTCFSILFGFMKTESFFVKMFQGSQRKKTPESYILYSSTDELISKMELNFKSIFHDLKTEK
jgi:hypothetical protein